MTMRKNNLSFNSRSSFFFIFILYNFALNKIPYFAIVFLFFFFFFQLTLFFSSSLSRSITFSLFLLLKEKQSTKNLLPASPILHNNNNRRTATKCLHCIMHERYILSSVGRLLLPSREGEQEIEWKSEVKCNKLPALKKKEKKSANRRQKERVVTRCWDSLNQSHADPFSLLYPPLRRKIMKTKIK